MVEIPAGKFIMGHTLEQARALDEAFIKAFGVSYLGPNLDPLPQLTVKLDTFQIDEMEVSIARYQRCVEADVCQAVISLGRLPADRPIVSVTWDDADAYCRWVGKRLPTEAEWEKAARGTDGRLYPWGNVWDDRYPTINYGDSWDKLRPIGHTPQDVSPFGVRDMAGNASEWTNDWYLLYPSNPYLANVTDAAKGDKVFRGEISIYRAISSRSHISPRNPSDLLGFRCVRGPELPPVLTSAVISASIRPMIPPLATSVDLTHMSYVPTGPFIMGIGAGAEKDDPYNFIGSPAHVVYLDSFYIDRHEITIDEYAKFLNALCSNFLRCYGFSCVHEDHGRLLVPWMEVIDGHYQAQPGYANRPVVHVSWQGARAYCEWVGKRLPTEAEWEKAARGTDGRLYPWGNEFGPSRAATPPDFTEAKYPEPVGTHPGDVSPYGVYDMAGNAVEWVADWFSSTYYASSPYANPQGPEDGGEHVLRGIPGILQEYSVTYREFGDYGLFNGFRCAYVP